MAFQFKINKLRFPGGKRKALTLSYDDGIVQDRHLVELMDKYGVKGTFNLNTALLGRSCTIKIDGRDVEDSVITEQEIPRLYEKHEVATHAARHIALTECGSAALYEILEDRKVLEGLVPYLVQGHAYPFGIYDESVLGMLEAAGIRYARTVVSTGTFEIPDRFLEWHPTCHHADPRLMELAKKFCEEEENPQIINRPQLFYLWGHSYEFARQDNWEVIENFLSYVSGYREKIWMATNGEIASYVEAYRSLVFSADGAKVYNPSCQTIWLEAVGEIYSIAPGETATLRGYQ